MNDPIIDLIIRIKNGYMSRRNTVEINHSLYAMAVLEKLEKLGYVADVGVTGDIKKIITIKLVYKEGDPAVTGVLIHSKPGKRMYATYRKLKPVLGGIGCSFLSTSKGILTDKESKKSKLGGELLFSLW